MNRAVYDRMAAQEQVHWWFVGRRAIIRALIEREVKLGRDARILEAGCGTGGNLELLSRYGQIEGFEFDPEARRLATNTGFPVSLGALPDQVAEPDAAYDLVGLFDVLEHVENDVAALETLGRKLKAGGSLLITVPAMPWLWSSHDTTHHHYRRYTARSLRRVIAAAGQRAVNVGYFNTLLFPLAAVHRGLNGLFGAEEATDEIPARGLNALLSAIFRFERHWVGRVPVPFGLSLFAVVRAPR